MKRENVAKWRELEARRSDVQYDIRSGRPSVVTDENIQKIFMETFVLTDV
jgi:hypothetical protein